MIDYLIVSGELSLVALLAIACLRSAPARWRLWATLGALPIVVFPWSLLPPIELEQANPTVHFLDVLPVLTAIDSVAAIDPTNASWSPWQMSWLAAIAIATAIGLFAYVVLVVRQRARSQRWETVAQDGDPLLSDLPLHLRANCLVRIVPKSDLAVATGFFSPTVWLGENHLGHERLRTVLVHELVHVRRRHTQTAAVLTLLRCLLWWHPFTWVWAWVARRQIEYDCDEECARLLGKDRYRGALAALIRDATSWPTLVGLLGHRSFDIRRLRALERVKLTRAHHRVVVAVAVCAVPLFVVDFTVVAGGTVPASSGLDVDHGSWQFLAPEGGEGWQAVTRDDGQSVIQIAPNTTIRVQSEPPAAASTRPFVVVRGKEYPRDSGGNPEGLQALPLSRLGGTSAGDDPRLELSCSTDLEEPEASIGFHSNWAQVETPGEVQDGVGGLLRIRTHTGTSATFRKPLHSGSATFVEYRFDEEPLRIADVDLSYRVDLSTPANWESRFMLDRQAVARIAALAERPDQLLLSVSNTDSGYRTGQISFDLAASQAELDKFLRECDAAQRGSGR